MKQIKPLLITAYLVIAVLSAIYGSLWGAYDYKGFAYNLGRGLVWPVIMFPSLGKLISLLVIIGLLTLVTVFRKGER